MEFGELLARDALEREESCGGHFREEYQDNGEAKRNDERYTHAAVWQYQGFGHIPKRNEEQLVWQEVHPTQRSYK